MASQSARSGVVALLVLAAFCAGCAGMAPDQAEEKQEKVYRTGSNLPQKERSDVKVVDPASVQDTLRSGSRMPGRGAGN